ncbi:hypothetical protein TWF191_000160 [Orbilia oligospora]|uniref:Peptidase A1 domain-containing protein n=1 Tax=Orbilia oligospora TaxID=2813651 RepID=A0A7C8R6A4_ORBOL|nr:hypothetical protein TWF191_000160 [Orbilia oligospora]
MYRRKIFSTIVSVGLLLIPSVYGQFPGKNTNGEGSGTGINLEEATETQESSPAQTTIATSTSDNCNRPVQLIGLSNDGPYIPVLIDGTGPYNLAVSFEEEGTYIFSQKFCREALKIDGEPCFYTASPSELGIDDEEHTVNTGEGGLEFEYITQPTEAKIGQEGNSVVFERYIGEIQPVTNGFSSSPNSGFTRDIRIDPMAPYNIVPRDISDAVEGGFAAGSSADITIAGVTFNIPWTGLVYAGAVITESGATMILGAPFLQYIYAATLPGGRQNVVFARDSGASTAEFKPFSEILTTLPTKTQPGNSQSSSSNSPDRKVENSGDENEPIASDPMMVKSSGNNIGAIVGGVVGGVVGLLIILVAACCFYRRRKLMKGNSPRSVEKEYEADFDAEIGHHDGFLPQFKESGYATLPTPPPPPGQETRPQIPSLILGSPINAQYDSQTEYTPTLHPYHDESPSRSLNVTPLPPPSQTPILTIPPVPERRLSITPSLSIEPPSPLSRNVSAASRQNFPSISQLQRNRSNVRAVPEEDDYDVVSMASGPIYNPILASQEASSSAPRLPFTHRPESGGAMGMTDRGAGL